MPSIDRDRNIIRHILKYCDEVNTAHEDFSCSKKIHEQLYLSQRRYHAHSADWRTCKPSVG